MSRPVVDVTAVLLRPVRQGNALEATLERLLAGLRLGVFPEGHRLPAERELASRLAVSRVTLREALQVLQAAGYVEARRGRYGGTFVVELTEVVHRPPPAVRPPTPARPPAPTPSPTSAASAPGPAGRGGVEDALVLRQVVEVGAAAAAALLGPPPEAVVDLEGRLAACAAAPPSRYDRADARLHLAIAEATGSVSVVAAVAEARMRLHDLLAAVAAAASPIERARSDAGHAAVVAAVRAGDPAGAAAAMSAHLAATAAWLRLRGVVA